MILLEHIDFIKTHKKEPTKKNFDWLKYNYSDNKTLPVLS